MDDAAKWWQSGMEPRECVEKWSRKDDCPQSEADVIEKFHWERVREMPGNMDNRFKQPAVRCFSLPNWWDSLNSFFFPSLNKMNRHWSDDYDWVFLSVRLKSHFFFLSRENRKATHWPLITLSHLFESIFFWLLAHFVHLHSNIIIISFLQSLLIK